MAALGAARSTKQVAADTVTPRKHSLLMAGSTTIYKGALVCLNSSGYATPGAASTTLVAVGRAEETVTNSGSAGAAKIEVTSGVFYWNNSSAGDLIAITDRFKTVYVVDDQTVAKTDGSSARSAAGKVYTVDSNGVAVFTSPL